MDEHMEKQTQTKKKEESQDEIWFQDGEETRRKMTMRTREPKRWEKQ